MYITFNYPHTLVILCGPTRSGKTTFATKTSAALQGMGYTTKHISSDAIRQQLLQDESHPHSARMLHVSQQAFDLLFAQTEAYMAYPVNTEFVFVDTRGYDVAFRQRLLDLAKKHNYSTAIVTFDYSKPDYFKGVSEEERDLVEKDVVKYKRKCLPELKRRDYHCSIRVSRKDDLLQDFLVSLTFEGDTPTALAYEGCKCVGREPSRTYAIVGDVHEQVDALKEMYAQLLATDPYTRVVLAGDWIDRGGRTKEMVEFLYKRMVESDDVFVIGNHESYVYRRLNNLIDTPASPEVETEYFTSLAVLQQDEALRTKFERIMREAVPFFKVDSPTSSFIVTHAPCETKYLGKVDPVSRRNQRNFYIKDREADVREQLGFVYNSVGNYPVHIFGHLAHNSKTLKYRNNVFLDTGAVYGNALSAMVWNPSGFRYYQVACSSGACGQQSLPDLLAPVEKPFNIRDYELEDRDYWLLNSLRDNGIKYISGTMSPAPSTSTQLEGVEAALSYFAKRHVYDVCLQPKYMGSRAQLYLHFEDFSNPDGELDKSFFVSRNGWKIKHVPEATKTALRSFLKSETLCKNLAGPHFEWTIMVLDGELLPWSVLGKGLIEEQFLPYQELVRNTLGTLENDVVAQELDLFSENEVQERLKLAENFAETLALYSGDEEPTYKAFGILSIDGTVVDFDNHYQFVLVNDDPILRLDLREESFGNSLRLAQSFFDDRTVVEKMEGMVVKPCFWTDALKSVPYMKVRNENYLSLVYGYDYKLKYSQLCYQKNISSKASLSLKEAKLAREMLEATPEKVRECAVKLISTMKQEASLDPRL